MKKSIRILVMILAMLISLPCRAYSFELDGIYYDILSETERTVAVTYRVNGSIYTYRGSIEIPSKLIYQSKTYTVAAVGYEAFYNNTNLTSITLPNSLTSIGYSAFKGCTALTSITLPNSLTTIGEHAFEGCTGLTTLTMPNSLTTIQGNAFSRCSSLTSITLPNSLTSIGANAFSWCTSLTSITLPNSPITIRESTFYSCTELTSITLPNSLITIRDKAFGNCTALASITLPNSLTTIEDYAFQNCTALTSITLPSSLTTLSNRAFSGCAAMININVEADNTTFSSIDGVLYDKSLSTIIICPARKTSITLPNSLTTIREYAFSGCRGLTSITLPPSLTTIGDYAFSGCRGLTSITLPSSLTAIGKEAFNYCNTLEKILMKCQTPIECTPGFSDDVLKNAILYIPKGTSAAYNKVDPWRNFWNIEEMEFNGVSDIENDNTTLRVTVSDGVLTINGIDCSETLTIYDMQGHTIYTGTARSIDSLAPGLYIIRAGSQSTKFSI